MSLREYIAGVVLLGALGACEPSGADSGSEDGVAETGGDPYELTADEQLCLDYCLSNDGVMCTDEPRCFGLCMDRIAWGDERACGQEARDVAACEAASTLDGRCESVECLDVYKEDDLCRGWCAHLDGTPGSGATQTSCMWHSTCYGHEFEVDCPVGAASGDCVCRVDGQDVDQCASEIELQPFQCGPQDLHIFDSCCRPIFEGVLFP